MPMMARVATVAFRGVEVDLIDVQVMISGGLPRFQIVGLPDKAVAESKERVRAALQTIGLDPPMKRITVNLAPADMDKRGSHYDLPIALALMAAMGSLPADELEAYVVLGELGLDGRTASVSGVLPSAVYANHLGKNLICPAGQGEEAAWAAREMQVLAPPDLISLINHFRGVSLLATPQPQLAEAPVAPRDLIDIKGQESAKRALEIAAAGGHNLLMIGPPGAGKSMLARRLPGLLPPLSPAEALDVSIVHSLAGSLPEGRLLRARPYRDPHHSASLPALVGGGSRAKPGEVSLAHRGVLFLDELPEVSRPTLEALRQPLETGEVSVARVNAHVTYPARFQLIAAMNPCKCGYLGDPGRACSRAPRCGADYQARISGPLLDRIDLVIEVPAVPASVMAQKASGEDSSTVAQRVAAARQRQQDRFHDQNIALHTNAEAEGAVLEAIAPLDSEGRSLLAQAAEQFALSARGYHRVLRVARTLADLECQEHIERHHLTEALQFRLPSLRQ